MRKCLTLRQKVFVCIQIANSGAMMLGYGCFAFVLFLAFVLPNLPLSVPATDEGQACWEASKAVIASPACMQAMPSDPYWTQTCAMLSKQTQ
jgi:hypothetical protein